MWFGPASQAASSVSQLVEYLSSSFLNALLCAHLASSPPSPPSLPPSFTIPLLDSATDPLLPPSLLHLPLPPSTLLPTHLVLGGVLLIGYEMYRLLSLSVPSIGGNKMAVKRRKTKSQANNQNSSFVDLEENEREMEKLMGE